MRRKVCVAICLCLAILWVKEVSSSSGLPGDFSPGSEPEGFRGIKWGTDLSSLGKVAESLKEIRTDLSFGGVDIYLRRGDELTLDGVDLERIEYLFWRGQFCGVRLYAKGYSDFLALKEAMFARFGPGYQSNKFIERYIWLGKITSLFLRYNGFSREGTLSMTSSEVYKQWRKYDSEKAKEGAEKRFD